MWAWCWWKSACHWFIERKGKVVAKVSADIKRKTDMPLINENVELGSKIITDEYRTYGAVSKSVYTYETVNHASKQYVSGEAHTNTLENFWSQVKRSINGTFHAVSPAYLQSYVDEYAFRYNARNAGQHTFHLILAEAVRSV